MAATEGKHTGKSNFQIALLDLWGKFKAAAWLQVLLLIVCVIAIAISIPYIVSAITEAVNRRNTQFFSNNNITYSEFEAFISGDDSSCNGSVGNGLSTDTGINENEEGFLVMFYKDNCSECDSMQYYMEQWYNDYNREYANNNLKFYTINVGWVPGDVDASTNVEGKDPSVNYKNENITLDQQYQMQQNIKDVYLKQDATHKNSQVTQEVLDKKLDSQSGGGTMPTPTFVLYTKAKTDSKYLIDEPTKVVFGMEGSLSNSSRADIATQMLDLYNFQTYKAA